MEVQQNSTLNTTTFVDQGQMESLKKELENIKLEKMYLQNQLLTTQAQKDESKKLYDTLLTMINQNQQNTPMTQQKENQQQQYQSCSKDIMEKMQHLQQKMLDLEQSNQVLRNFKNLYKAASEIKCCGCNKSFSPVIFKGHYLKCSKIV